jgi:hypothetical protein
MNPYVYGATRLAVSGATFFVSRHIVGLLYRLSRAVAVACIASYSLWETFLPINAVEDFAVQTLCQCCLIPGRRRVPEREVASSKELLEGPVSLPEYSHFPLAPGNTIRLLKLQAAGASPAQLVCELEAVDVDTAPPDRAISYRWGSVERTNILAIGGGSKSYLPITKSSHFGIPLGRSPPFVDQLHLHIHSPTAKFTPPETAVFSATFLSESENICSCWTVYSGETGGIRLSLCLLSPRSPVFSLSGELYRDSHIPLVQVSPPYTVQQLPSCYVECKYLSQRLPYF